MNLYSDTIVTPRSNCFSERRNINGFIGLHILLYNKRQASGATMSVCLSPLVTSEPVYRFRIKHGISRRTSATTALILKFCLQTDF
jgi:hypothetical protein